jgi:hypothetical protein
MLREFWIGKVDDNWHQLAVGNGQLYAVLSRSQSIHVFDSLTGQSPKWATIGQRELPYVRGLRMWTRPAKPEMLIIRQMSPSPWFLPNDETALFVEVLTADQRCCHGVHLCGYYPMDVVGLDNRLLVLDTRGHVIVLDDQEQWQKSLPVIHGPISPWSPIKLIAAEDGVLLTGSARSTTGWNQIDIYTGHPIPRWLPDDPNSRLEWTSAVTLPGAFCTVTGDTGLVCIHE